MLVQLEETTQAQYKMLYVSQMDLSSASFCLNMLIKKGWFSKTYERRGSVYQQQTAYTTAFVIAYNRAFSGRRPAGFPSKLLRSFSYEEKKCHERMKELRNSVYAHSDERKYTIRPWRSKDFQTMIVGSPTFCLAKEEADLLRSMIAKLDDLIDQRINALLPPLRSSQFSPDDLPFGELEVGESFVVPYESE